MQLRRKSFKGGYRFRRFEGRLQPNTIHLDIPELVTIPIHASAESLLVHPGEHVHKGQIIAREENVNAAPAIATVNGSVAEIGEIDWFGNVTPTVIIRNDGDSASQAGSNREDWVNLSREALEECLYQAGTTGLCSPGIPTKLGNSTLKPEGVAHILIHAVHSDLYRPPDVMLLREHPLEHFRSGILILKKINPQAHVHIVVDSARTNLIRAIRTHFEDDGDVSLYQVPAKYPQHDERMLTRTILGLEVPYRSNVADIGVVVLDFPSILHIYEAVVEEKPLIDRIIHLSSPGEIPSKLVHARIGTPVETIVRTFMNVERPLRVILNSALTGKTIKDLTIPVDSSFSSLICVPEEPAPETLSFSRPGFHKDSYTRAFLSNYLPTKKKWSIAVQGEKRPCINCNFCAEVCPSRILPHLLHKYIIREVIDESLIRYNIFACIECNLCSYVCPSKIPVAQHIKTGMEKLIKEGFLENIDAATGTDS